MDHVVTYFQFMMIVFLTSTFCFAEVYKNKPLSYGIDLSDIFLLHVHVYLYRELNGNNPAIIHLRQLCFLNIFVRRCNIYIFKPFKVTLKKKIATY